MTQAEKRTVYVNGQFVPEDLASISIFDRGFLFGDAVYEVSAVINGKLLDNDAHMARLERSLGQLEIPAPIPYADITDLQHQLIEKNNLKEGIVYLQISRGPAERDFNYPAAPEPSLVMFTQVKNLTQNPKAETGIRIITCPDIRWQRRDIKTVNLLPASMTKQLAAHAGADDAWMVEDGVITEGTSNNAFIIREPNILITRHLGNEILHGCTRRAILALAKQEGLEIDERPFTVDEALSAAEAFSTSASTFVMPVVEIDGTQIGTGQPGPHTQTLRELYIKTALETAA